MPAASWWAHAEEQAVIRVLHLRSRVDGDRHSRKRQPRGDGGHTHSVTGCAAVSASPPATLGRWCGQWRAAESLSHSLSHPHSLRGTGRCHWPSDRSELSAGRWADQASPAPSIPAPQRPRAQQPLSYTPSLYSSSNHPLLLRGRLIYAALHSLLVRPLLLLSTRERSHSLRVTAPFLASPTPPFPRRRFAVQLHALPSPRRALPPLSVIDWASCLHPSSSS